MAKKEFKAESKRLLDLMINSIYTPEMSVPPEEEAHGHPGKGDDQKQQRRVISNASDAIDKLCYKSLTDENVGLKREDFRIAIHGRGPCDFQPLSCLLIVNRV